MATPKPDRPVDPNFPLYVYADAPLVQVYRYRTGKTKGPKLFMGEWMKIIEKGGKLPAKGRVRVVYRGGKGYVCREQLTWQRRLEVFFIDVDTGDAILIQTPDDRRVLIDGGQTDDAFQFIVNKYRLDKARNYIDFEAIVATHCDMDHTKGLLKILKHPKIAVKRVYHNGLFRRTVGKQDPGCRKGGRVYGLVDSPKTTDKPQLKQLMKWFVEAVDEARKNLPVVLGKMRTIPRWKGRVEPPPGGFQFKRLDAADKFLPPYDGKNENLTIEVLWPKAKGKKPKLHYPWYESVGETVNGNSIVLRLVHGKNRILLTGDMNEKSMPDLRKDNPKALRAEVYKAAHHGSQHFSVPFLKAVKPNAAVISSGDNKYDEHGHPRAVLLGTITRYSEHPRPAVFSTELAACFAKLPKGLQKDFNQGVGQLYERAIKGIVHLRSDGKQLCLGTVHGRKTGGAPGAGISWKWNWKWDHWVQ